MNRNLKTRELVVSESSLTVALATVARLDRDLSRALGHADLLAAHGHDAAESLSEICHALKHAVTNMRELRGELLTFAGNLSEQYLESALRERTAAVVSQLAELARAEPQTRPYRRELYRGKFRRLLDVSTYVLDQLGIVNETWFRARRCTVTADFTTQTQYREALVRADRAFVAIGDDADVQQFLCAGTWILSEPFRAACRVLATLLDVDVYADSRSTASEHEN